MKKIEYRIYKWIPRKIGQDCMYYPEYNIHTEWWKSPVWKQSSYCKTLEEAEAVIATWQRNGIPEESYYIKVK